MAEFVSRPQLNNEQRIATTDDTWRDYCFELDCKEIDGFTKPITKAEAIAVWLNLDYSWTSCTQYWASVPKSDADPRKIDEESRKRISTILKEEKK